MKAAVGSVSQSGRALLPAIHTAFGERYRKIIEEGKKGATAEVPKKTKKARKKEAPKAKNLLGHCHKY